jgi:hypothetical protein
MRMRLRICDDTVIGQSNEYETKRLLNTSAYKTSKILERVLRDTVSSSLLKNEAPFCGFMGLPTLNFDLIECRLGE